MAYSPAPPEPVAAAPTPSSDARMEKVAVAAGRMEKAAGKLGVATDRLAQASRQSTSAPLPTAAPVAVDSSALDRAVQNMERVASRFESTAQKMDAISQRLASQRSPGDSPPPRVAQAPTSAPSRQSSTRPSPINRTSRTATQTKATPAPALVAPAFNAALLALGKEKYEDEELGCVGCHKMNGEGGRSGPDLTFAGRLHPDVDWQIAHLKDPKSKIPGSSMPAYKDLPEADLRALATFLASRR